MLYKENGVSFEERNYLVFSEKKQNNNGLIKL